MEQVGLWVDLKICNPRRVLNPSRVRRVRLEVLECTSYSIIKFFISLVVKDVEQVGLWVDLKICNPRRVWNPSRVRRVRLEVLECT